MTEENKNTVDLDEKSEEFFKRYGEYARSVRNSFVIIGGDWVFPTPYMSSNATYSVSTPLVVNICTDPDTWKVSPIPFIQHHLCQEDCGVNIQIEGNKIKFAFMKDTDPNRPAFAAVEYTYELEFDWETLDRRDEFAPDDRCGPVSVVSEFIDDQYKSKLFFTSVLLQNHLAGNEMPPGIIFRSATDEEITDMKNWKEKEAV